MRPGSVYQDIPPLESPNACPRQVSQKVEMLSATQLTSGTGCREVIKDMIS